MADIEVTPDLLRSKASEVRSLKSSHDDTMARLRTLVLALSENWKGEAQDAFVGKFESMRSTFTNFSQMLEGYAKLMDTAANTIQAADDDLARQISGFR